MRLIRKLLADHPGADNQLNSKHHKAPDIPADYYPDVVDFTNKVAYEVPVYGKRKEHQWSKMPEGWRGVNVFTVDIWQKDEVWVWSSDGQYDHINKDD